MQKYQCFLRKMTGCLMLTVLLLCGCAGKNDLEIVTAPEEAADLSGADVLRESESRDAEGMMQAQEPEQPAETAEDAPIYVQVTGAVNHPGGYELSEGARVFEAIEKAGGMREDAKAESINQAQELSDGEMIVLYTKQEWEQMQTETGDTPGNPQQSLGAGGTDDDRVNINTATMEQLCSISGIGQSRAQSIITYREQNGAFGSIEEIMKVSGIKEGLFQKIKDKIKV